MDIGVQGPGIYLECSWDGLCWVLLVSQGDEDAFFLLLFALLGSFGAPGGFGMGCLGCVRVFVGVSPAHRCLCLWAIWCLRAVDRDVRLSLVLLSMIVLFPDYTSFCG